MNDARTLKPVIECLLFVADRPVSLDTLSSILGVEDKKLIRSVIDELEQDLRARQSSLQILHVARGYQFYTLREYAEWVKKLYKEETTHRLSRAALEVLSIIAYRQPITKAEIEKIRGVDSSGALSKILEKKLVRITGKKKTPGNPLLYGTTEFFLRYFGLKDISDMPELDELIKKEEEHYETQETQGAD